MRAGFKPRAVPRLVADGIGDPDWVRNRILPVLSAPGLLMTKTSGRMVRPASVPLAE
jgi:hypothetical protein